MHERFAARKQKDVCVGKFICVQKKNEKAVGVEPQKSLMGEANTLPENKVLQMLLVLNFINARIQ